MRAPLPLRPDAMSQAEAAPQGPPSVKLGLKENWPQFALLVVINAFVGGMVGIERTVVPLIGAEEFKIGSTTLVVSFIVSFGVVKACANLISGQLADKWGRKSVLVLGWLVGLPVPFMIIWAPSWEWVIAANALLGINQGLAWSMTVIMKIDLVGPKSRGLAVGLNEFAGYLAVGVTAYLTGYLASEYGLRPAPIYLGVAYAVLGAGLSILLVRDTREHVRLETAAHARLASPISFREIFVLTSFRDRNLFAASQAGLVNNLNDGMSWGIFPLFFVSFGLAVDRIGILKAVYPATWGVLQVATGPLSDRWGRKGLIVAGMWVQGRGPVLNRDDESFRVVARRQPAARTWHRHGVPELDRRRIRRLASELAGAPAQRLPLLARSRLRDRGPVGRHHRRPVRAFGGNFLDRHAHVYLGRRRRGRHARAQGWLA
ncbi:MFS family permease [Bradyrhizobium sp. GM24.11]